MTKERVKYVVKSLENNVGTQWAEIFFEQYSHLRTASHSCVFNVGKMATNVFFSCKKKQKLGEELATGHWHLANYYLTSQFVLVGIF